MENVTIKRCLMYRRVGTSEPRTVGSSLDVQEEALVQFAASMHAPLALDFVEVASGAGGTKALRVEQVRLFASVLPGDLIAVTNLDRLARDLDVVRRQVGRILNKGARFVSLAEGEFDRSPAGQFKLSILNFFARKG